MSIPSDYRPPISSASSSSGPSPSVNRFEGLPGLRVEDSNFSEVPYVRCNEGNQLVTLEALKVLPKVENGCHIGFSCWYNLDVIALREPQLAIICDINKQMFGIYSLIEKNVIESNTPKEFLERFQAGLPENVRAVFDIRGGIGGIDNLLTDQNGWLGSQKNYDAVRKMHLEGRVKYLPLNIAETGGAFEQINRWLGDNDLVCDTLYASNIREWLKERSTQAEAAMVRNLEKIIAPTTLVVDACRESKIGGDTPLQRISEGKVEDIVYKQRRPAKRQFRAIQDENSGNDGDDNAKSLGKRLLFD